MLICLWNTLVNQILGVIVQNAQGVISAWNNLMMGCIRLRVIHCKLHRSLWVFSHVIGMTRESHLTVTLGQLVSGCNGCMQQLGMGYVKTFRSAHNILLIGWNAFYGSWLSNHCAIRPKIYFNHGWAILKHKLLDYCDCFVLIDIFYNVGH